MLVATAVLAAILNPGGIVAWIVVGLIDDQIADRAGLRVDYRAVRLCVRCTAFRWAEYRGKHPRKDVVRGPEPTLAKDEVVVRSVDRT